MAHTLTCHACGTTLTLFVVDVKKRKGTIRCNHCGARISYDLDSPRIQRSGNWAVTTPSFDGRAKERLMKQMERSRKQKEGAAEKASPAKLNPFGENPFQAKPGFAKFDFKTGKILDDEN